MHIPDGINLLAKCEWFNPGGSVKDRPALSMVLAAERAGVLRKGMTLLDASSGNTGIAYAMVAAARGYQLVLCLPKNASMERRQLLASYGATIVDTDPLEGSDGAIREARRLSESEPDLLYLDQYSNPANWQAHFQSTGPEILAQSEGKITHFVACVGTGGTFTGVGRFLRQAKPDVQLIEVQPDGPFHGLEGRKCMEPPPVPSSGDSELAEQRIVAPTKEA
jgi:cysteine synthase B